MLKIVATAAMSADHDNDSEDAHATGIEPFTREYIVKSMDLLHALVECQKELTRT